MATAALSASDVWSVGGTDQPGQSNGDTLIEHWDGHTWSRVKSPNSPGSEVSSLDSITAISADDIWASGTGAAADGSVYGLMEHWDGTRWRAVDVPKNPASNVNYLQAVSAATTSDVWVAADYVNAEGVWIPYAEHWDGHVWSIVAVPQLPGSLQTFLTGVATVSADDAWVVGQVIDSSGTPVTLAEHWNGTKWEVVSTPNPAQAQASGFSAVDATSGGNVWAVGNATTSAGTDLTLVEHWNGKKWTLLPSPNGKGGGGSVLAAVSAVHGNDAWAVGESQQNSGRERTLIEHWDGREWAMVAGPDVGGAQATTLTGVSASSSKDAWATGSSYTSAGVASVLDLRWNGRKWRISR